MTAYGVPDALAKRWRDRQNDRSGDAAREKQNALPPALPGKTPGIPLVGLRRISPPELPVSAA